MLQMERLDRAWVPIRVFEEGEGENRAQGERDFSVDEAPKKMGSGEAMQRAGGHVGLGNRDRFRHEGGRERTVSVEAAGCVVLTVSTRGPASVVRKVGGPVPRREGGRRR